MDTPAFGVCPHCRSRISPSRVLRITRRTPYACPSCAGRAVITPQIGMIVLIGYVAVLGMLLFALDALRAPRLAVFSAAASGVRAMPSVFARFGRFEALPRRDPHAPS
ncbi:MAG: hypothetical protein IT177_03630 [Acidobacteria bacterium]|nr:hypothetical protein [Acidobacteriota bacterium]